MAWYDEAVFYHIYPLGMTGEPKQNDYGKPVHRLNTLLPWISHIKEIGCNVIYYLLNQGYNVFIYDQRCHGLSDKLTDRIDLLHVDSFKNYVKDLS